MIASQGRRGKGEKHTLKTATNPIKYQIDNQETGFILQELFGHCKFTVILGRKYSKNKKNYKENLNF